MNTRTSDLQSRTEGRINRTVSGGGVSCCVYCINVPVLFSFVSVLHSLYTALRAVLQKLSKTLEQFISPLQTSLNFKEILYSKFSSRFKNVAAIPCDQIKSNLFKFT